MSATHRRRRADIVSAAFVAIALTEILTMGAVIVYTRAVELQPQAVVNQRQTDRIESLDARIARVESSIIDLPKLIERTDRAVKDIADMHAMHTAIFVALAMNLIATIVQIRSQSKQRRVEQIA